MKLIIMSDTHYIAREMFEDNGKTLLEKGERLDLLLKPILTEKALEQAENDSDTDTILITGDLTNWGDMPSHIAFRELLRSMKSRGKKIFVTTATHDCHHNHPYVKKVMNNEIHYIKAPWNETYFDFERSDVKYRDCVAPEFKHLSEQECTPLLAEAMPVEDMADFYREFGIDEAISYHAASGSYCAQLDEKTRVLMLNDNFRDIDAYDDVSPTYSTTCFKWMRDMLDAAARDGMFIFACTHHPLTPPVPAYRLGASNRNMRRPDIGHALADMGLRLVFSGHSHFCNTTFLRSAKGNIIYDITTPSSQTFPAQFRKAEICPETGHVKTSTVDVGEIDVAVRGSKSTAEFVKELFFKGYRDKVSGMDGIAGKLVRETTCGKLMFLVKRVSKMSDAEVARIKDVKLYQLAFKAAENMLAGDGTYTPDTAEYKFIMGLCAVADSIVNAQPFTDVRVKYFKGYSLGSIAQPMLFNNNFSDSEAEFCVFDKISNKYNQPAYSSSAGQLLIAILTVLSLLLSPLELIAVITAIPVLSAKKITKLKQFGVRPADVYSYDLI